MAELHVELVAAARKVWSGEAGMVLARTGGGDIGIQPGHTPVLGTMDTQPVTIRQADGSTVVAALHARFQSIPDHKR